ncbi:hypothetical protein BGLA2_1170016 [Burkholderia gladioli]|nr:hypothetical protein BGLA2_1170016 [Burkholderia gladioli]
MYKVPQKAAPPARQFKRFVLADEASPCTPAVKKCPSFGDRPTNTPSKSRWPINEAATE